MLGITHSVLKKGPAGPFVFPVVQRLFFFKTAPILASSLLPSDYGLMAAVEAKS
jgi:hypothetical protein